MNRILWYELKRLIWNKVFMGLFTVTMIYGWLLLRGAVIRGIADTAPFSPWSYGYYMAQVMPVLLIVLLFFITALYSRNEKKVQVITRATKVRQTHYTLIKITSLVIGFAILCTGVCLVAMIFYITLFRFHDFSAFAVPMFLTLIPPAIFALGLGLLLGKFHVGPVYGLMPVLLIYGALPLPYEFGITGANFFSQYPMELDVLDPPFAVPAGFVISRFIYLAVGSLMIIFSILKKDRKN